ncbi:MAG: DUF3795 domain-containing protein [Actinomycetota bacterium]|nr:DUF3795 domain-containing protein [Actinomycetota bacterium]
MEEFKRENPLFSLCGLNCGLCTMRLGGHCPGCGQGNKPCKVARCAMRRGIEYCFECSDYPCEIYDHADEYDSFITHLDQKADMQKAKEIGIEAYTAEQEEKVKLLEKFLAEYNSGREKTLFSLAVNLLDIEDVESVLQEAGQLAPDTPIREKARFAAKRLREIAGGKGIELNLRKKVK